MRDLEVKVMGSSVGVSVRLPLRDFIMLHMCEGLHLWEHDLTVWVHFCLVQCAML